jgi:uncharacterized protein YigA (DUF484 family)
MNKQPSSEGIERTTGWEETVTRFLESTPDYFLRHPDLLAALVIPHPETGRAVSLVERQVRVLRDQNDAHSRQLHELIANARDNDQLAERLQRFALAVVDAAALDDLLDTAQDMLRQEFSLDGVAVRLTGNPRPACARPEFVEANDAMLDALQNLLAERNGQPVCGELPEVSIITNLFGPSADAIRSTAIIGLERRGLHGVLVLGSGDAQRFRPDMGTVYLARLGDLLMAGIARHLTAAVHAE